MLALDCEGSETEILAESDMDWRCIIVETHGNRRDVASLLEANTYEIVRSELAEREPYATACRENGIEVLVAVK